MSNCSRSPGGTTSPRSRAIPLSSRTFAYSPRCLDPDGMHSNAFDDRDIFNRFVSPSPPSDVPPGSKFRADSSGARIAPTSPQISVALALMGGGSGAGSGVKGNSSPRPAVTVLPLSSQGDPAEITATRFIAGTPTPPRRQPPSLPFVRPHSPVGETPPESVVSLQMMQQLSPRGAPRSPILSATDVDKITAWLHSLKRETRQFSSYFLYCEMLFREGDVLLRGKSVPNRLQTAIAFHCLCRATSVFGRHEGILHRICVDLGAAIFMNHDQLPIREEEMHHALGLFTDRLTYYDHQSVLHQQRERMEKELKQQALRYDARVKEEHAQKARIEDLEARYKIRALEKVSQRNTAHYELNEKLQIVLRSFQFMDEDEKQHVVLGVIEALRAHITADTLVSITDQISSQEREKLLRGLFRDELNDLTENIRAEVLATSSAQQNVIMERSVARITRFQALIWRKLQEVSPENLNNAIDINDAISQLTHHHEQSRLPGLGDMDGDLCEQDRQVLESLTELVDELRVEKRKRIELEQQLRDADVIINDLRWKSNVQITQAQEEAVQHAREAQELKETISKTHVQREEKEVQTEHRGGDYDNIGDEDDDDDCNKGTSSSGKNGPRVKRRALTGSCGAEDDDLLLKNRRVNKYGLGVASLIEQARIPSSKIRKILSKRKPLTLNELHAIIIGYYQAKMFQDVQDDNAGKLRANLAQFIMDMYTLHYGLKDLAISQLVFLDASIRKHAAESPRVRTFGLLTGSLEPDSHACSVQGIDFFLFVIVVMFNAGVYKKGRQQAVNVAQNLKSFFGEGIYMGPRSTSLKTDVICTTIDLAFSFTRSDPAGKLDRLKDEIRLLCSSQAASLNGGIEVDIALEKIMNYWFMLYEQQIDDIHAMFTLVDSNGDGILDFSEFCGVVQVLEPGMERREALAVYNKAAGDDNVIDKDEFVQVMLTHQRGVILKEVYGGDSNKKILSGIQQRIQTVIAPATERSSVDIRDSLQSGISKTSVVDSLGREETYASLVAAMESAAPRTQSFGPTRMNTDDIMCGITDIADDTVGNLDKDEDDTRVQESISFLTLSRLSVWATDAKAKLLNLRRPNRPVTSDESSPAITRRSSITVTDSLVSVDDKPLAVIAESRNYETFTSDVSELLEDALSKANINIKDVVD